MTFAIIGVSTAFVVLIGLYLEHLRRMEHVRNEHDLEMTKQINEELEHRTNNDAETEEVEAE